MIDETPHGKPLISFEELTPFHVKRLEPAVRQGQRLFKGTISERVLGDMVAGPAKALVKDGEPIAAAGLIDEGEGRARAWALITDALSLRVWPLVVIQMRAGIEAALHPETGFAQRVYAETVYDWPDGHKLLLHLGMHYEGMNRGAFPGGRHGVTYARVRADVPALPTRCSAVMAIVERCLWEDSMGLPLHGVRSAA